jgi:hypothetical protein
MRPVVKGGRTLSLLTRNGVIQASSFTRIDVKFRTLGS